MLESFLSSVESLSPIFKLAVVVVILGGFSLVESMRPAVALNYPNRWHHAGINLTLTLFTMIITLVFGIAVVGVTEWVAVSRFGLLQQLDLPLWLELLIALVVLDFVAQYLAHVLLHKLPWMWRVHIIHHSDTRVDATTGTRHHPLDFITREVFALFAVALLGMPLAFYALYRLLTIPFTYFIHANIALPESLDRWLSLVFVTPNMHKYHHHVELPWTDSNYGGVLSIWDRLFGTFTRAEAENIRYGLNILEGESTDDVGYLLSVPFRKGLQRDADMPRQFEY